MSDEKKRTTTDGEAPDGVTRGAPKPIDPETGMHGAYYVLPEEERAKGHIRPLRASYKHIGIRPKHLIRDLTSEEKERFASGNYAAYEEFPDTEGTLGRFWTQAQLDSGCGGVTTMSDALAATYARQPDYYGSTFCSQCKAHFPVGALGEFVWDGTDERVGT